ncbi:MAG: diaminopimelate decarboxylase [Anaerolineales bacterium]
MLTRLTLFPDTTHIILDTLTIGGLNLASLAEEYGTPLYLYDRATMDASVEEYRAALKAHYPAEAKITYAGKAFLCTAIAEWIEQTGLWADCTGAGEIAVAVAGKVPRERILVHGVNKSEEDLAAARAHAGTIVVDNLSELERLKDLKAEGMPSTGRSAGPPNVWLRLQPGLAVATHHSHTQTGQHGSKFGMTSEELIGAARICKEKGLPLNGVHFHQGSNFREPAPLVSATELALELVKEIGMGEAWHFCPGGGWSVAYHEDELPQPDINEYVRVIAQTVLEKCKALGLHLPILHLEPGRSLVARAGVALYRVGAVKRHSDRTWLLVDGGMTDNPRHALYGSKYSCLPVRGLGREMNERVFIAGPYCESGDVLIEDLPMPRIEEGELIAVPASGAYHLSMSSNYNGGRRPAVVWIESGASKIIVRRETIEDLSRRDASIIQVQKEFK